MLLARSKTPTTGLVTALYRKRRQPKEESGQTGRENAPDEAFSDSFEEAGRSSRLCSLERLGLRAGEKRQYC
jgi:hypothetical protein